MIYFVEAVGPDHIKIGFTDKPMEKRLDLLQTGNSFPLRVLGMMEGAKQDERRLHRQFRGSRVRGEWFRPTPELLNLIRTQTKHFPLIELMDASFSKKVTSSSLHAMPSSNELFNWKDIFSEITRRLDAGESKSVAEVASHLEVDNASSYCGWVEGVSRRHYQRVCYLLFLRNNNLYRFQVELSMGGDYIELPKTLAQFFPKGSYRLVCSSISQKLMQRFLANDNRLYI